MSRDPNPMMPAPSGPAHPSVSPVIVQCPNCGSSQFFGEKRLTGLGIALIITGFIGILVSIVLMFFFVGFCTIILFLPMPIIGAFQRKYINVCAKCRQKF